jgi:hypothetical protein
VARVLLARRLVVAALPVLPVAVERVVVALLCVVEGCSWILV